MIEDNEPLYLTLFEEMLEKLKKSNEDFKYVTYKCDKNNHSIKVNGLQYFIDEIKAKCRKLLNGISTTEILKLNGADDEKIANDVMRKISKSL